jgi:hypothetical protein
LRRPLEIDGLPKKAGGILPSQADATRAFQDCFPVMRSGPLLLLLYQYRGVKGGTEKIDAVPFVILNQGKNFSPIIK